MTTWADQIPVDRISEEARQARPGRTALTVIAAVLFGLGWVAAKAFAVAWLAAAWSVTAVRVGWTSAHGPSRTSRLAAVTADRDRWREEARRLGG